jgi:DHA2 family multidrug resistance protein
MMIGETMFVSGLAMFFTAPFAGILARKVDMRIMIMIGLLGFAVSSWMLTGLTADWDFHELFLPQILRGVSLMLCMVTVNNLALGTLPPERMKNASGLFNLTRNLGGAVGLALINTQLVDRGRLHFARLADDVSWSNPAAMHQMNAMAQSMTAKGLDGPKAALAQMMGQVSQQARLLSFIDVFLMLAVLFASLAGFALLMRKPGGPVGAGH